MLLRADDPDFVYFVEFRGKGIFLRAAPVDVSAIVHDLLLDKMLQRLRARGLVKVVEDADRGVLVGATAVGPYGGEILGFLAVAVHAAVPVATLRSMIYAYPTFHRAIESALADLATDA